MAIVSINKLDAIRRLRGAGFDEKQVETVVRVLSDAQANLLTRATCAEISAKFDKLIWMAGITLVLYVVNFAKLFF